MKSNEIRVIQQQKKYRFKHAQRERFGGWYFLANGQVNHLVTQASLWADKVHVGCWVDNEGPRRSILDPVDLTPRRCCGKLSEPASLLKGFPGDLAAKERIARKFSFQNKLEKLLPRVLCYHPWWRDTDPGTRGSIQGCVAQECKYAFFCCKCLHQLCLKEIQPKSHTFLKFPITCNILRSKRNRWKQFNSILLNLILLFWRAVDIVSIKGTIFPDFLLHLLNPLCLLHTENISILTNHSSSVQ